MIASMPLFFTTGLIGLFMIPASLPHGFPVSHPRTPATIQGSALPVEDPVFTESLRRDIAGHPGDFLVFATARTAEIFILSHTEALPETDPRVAERGIKGYWKGNTLVVLPGLAN